MGSLVQPAERRAHRRYPISVDLEYSFGSEGRLQVGRGRTINLSNGGVLFEAETPVPVNTTVELSISWPILTGTQANLELHATGAVVRVTPRHVAVKFKRFTFRTTSPQKQVGANGNDRSSG